jgi:hypothetical protein
VTGASESKKNKRKPRSGRVCTICEQTVPFCWSCPCGFQLCQDCMNENSWGLTCNQITWECPDCGAIRGY